MIKLGMTDKLELGNMEAQRDWGYSGDYVRAMWLMMQQDEPDDYVICTGETHSVREFCQKAFSIVGLNYEEYVHTSPKLFRPAEVDLLIGDSTKAKKILKWNPTVRFDKLIENMVESDLSIFSSNL